MLLPLYPRGKYPRPWNRILSWPHIPSWSFEENESSAHTSSWKENSVFQRVAVTILTKLSLLMLGQKSYEREDRILPRDRGGLSSQKWLCIFLHYFTVRLAEISILPTAVWQTFCIHLYGHFPSSSCQLGRILFFLALCGERNTTFGMFARIRCMNTLFKFAMSLHV